MGWGLRVAGDFLGEFVVEEGDEFGVAILSADSFEDLIKSTFRRAEKRARVFSKNLGQHGATIGERLNVLAIQEQDRL